MKRKQYNHDHFITTYQNITSKSTLRLINSNLFFMGFINCLVGRPLFI